MYFHMAVHIVIGAHYQACECENLWPEVPNLQTEVARHFDFFAGFGTLRSYNYLVPEYGNKKAWYTLRSSLFPILLIAEGVSINDAIEVPRIIRSA